MNSNVQRDVCQQTGGQGNRRFFINADAAALGPGLLVGSAFTEGVYLGGYGVGSTQRQFRTANIIPPASCPRRRPPCRRVFTRRIRQK
ncbi:hypothetical protein EVAR_99335_1 [Eumeta japonica]|uniref:Uncharacterized protein n=1 Tax=Eumeta variegata TaxID=151549 RepID=A0A4C1ZHU1_EUMVA|nr:hypothetical protein EVAR_99335_1 [Eumeta japonica]